MPTTLGLRADSKECPMSATRVLTAALALVLIAAVPARATSVPTLTVIDSIRPGSGGSYALDAGYTTSLFGGWLYFAANDGTTGVELWRTNGTETQLVDNINPGGSDSNVDYLTPLGDWLYFRANDGTTGLELWRTNGTDTQLVEDIRLGSQDSAPYSYSAPFSDPYRFARLGDWLYFSAFDDTNGRELWRTNGSDTQLVEDINPGTNGSNPEWFAAFGDWLYFAANDGTTGIELWRTNGSDTQLVEDIHSGDNSYPRAFAPLGEWLYFTGFVLATGWELYRTNGTDTQLVQDIAPAGLSSYPNNFAVLDDWIYFQAYDVTTGYELWRTNGTDAVLVQDTNPGSNSGGAYSLTPLGDWLYFQSDDGTNNIELWRTNGTVTERVPFPSGEYISCDWCAERQIFTIGGRLFTPVYSAAIGNEFAYLDEPTYALPETNRDASGWTMTLVILAGLTAAAGVGLVTRGAKGA